jgi:hypothetical protein
LKKSGIVSLTRSNPFAFSYSIGGEVDGAVLQRDAIAAMMSVVACRIAPVYITLSLLCGEQKGRIPSSVKYWEIAADNLSKAGWSWGCVAAVDLDVIAPSHCGC